MPDQGATRPSAAAAAPPSTVRRLIVGLLFVTVVINYLDRGSISIAGPHIADELHLAPWQMGIVFSAFAWAYSPLQIPGSMLVDRIGPRILYPAAIFLWSLFATLQGLTATMAQLVAARFGVGASEVPSYPMNNRIITSWLPERERATAVGIYVSGQYVGLAFLTPALVALQTALGWRGMFLMTGALGLAWAVGFRALYRDPAESRANAAELRLIEEGGGQTRWGGRRDARAVAGSPDAASPAVPASVAFRSRKMWGLLLGHTGETCANWFFLTWFPTYLVKYRHIEFLKAGFLATLPFLAAWVGVLLSGFASDLLLRRGVSLSVARKVPIVTGLLLATSIVGANYAQTPAVIIACLTLAFFGSGLAAISWSVVSSVAPPNLVGLTSGVYNFLGTSMGIVVPLVIGFLVRGDDFSPALFFVGGMALLSVLSWTVVLGRIERITG